MRARFVVVGITLVCALACGGGGIVPVTPADKAVAYTASDVARDFGTFTVDPSKETWELEREFDGSYGLSYEYDGTNDEPVLYVQTLLSREKDSADAGITRSAYEIGASIGMAGTDTRDANELINWGTSTCQILVNDGNDVGNLCLLQNDNIAGMVMMVGAVWTEPGEATVALQPMFDKLQTWDPKGMPAE